MAKVKYIQHDSDWRTLQAFRDPTAPGWEIVTESARFFVDFDDVESYVAFFTKLQRASKKEEK